MRKRKARWHVPMCLQKAQRSKNVVAVKTSVFTSALPSPDVRFQGCVHIRNLTENSQIT